jgi:hypothetical protein
LIGYNGVAKAKAKLTEARFVSPLAMHRAFVFDTNFVSSTPPFDSGSDRLVFVFVS